MSLPDKVLEAALLQLDKDTRAVTDSGWIDLILNKLAQQGAALDASDPQKLAINVAVTTFSLNKEKITGLGAETFALFLDKLSQGEEQEAANIFLRATGSVDMLIEAMEQGTLGVIEAKRQLDKLWSDAWDLIKSVTITGAKLLLPLLLTLI